ncbi:Uncharacterized protein FWK35_00013176 [Aphis craccivora]|uniref:Uncharacterized protein n=1 Tax=Aphis craccivora TaxID=307492 RepID=A0A6G0YKH4_APHCR|nr:Uncharacterized protein FWK35_00013176 [Aphis craccivora]
MSHIIIRSSMELIKKKIPQMRRSLVSVLLNYYLNYILLYCVVKNHNLGVMYYLNISKKSSSNLRFIIRTSCNDFSNSITLKNLYISHSLNMSSLDFRKNSMPNGYIDCQASQRQIKSTYYKFKNNLH